MLLNNRYRIIRNLGSGGFGETFLAEDTQIPSTRRCVIKQLRLIQNNPQTYQIVQQRFAREAAILEELGDGNSQIPRLYAYFCEGEQFYLAQEYIQGQTLSEVVASGGHLRQSRVREILISLLNVLNYVHSKGIVHRDIKPENIIIRASDNQPVLIDFGAVRETMAAEINSQGNVTSSIVIGTPGFMPMEQAVGRAVFASDLYSLGLLGIYLLTAKLPQELQTDSYSGEIIWQRNSVTDNFAAVLDKAIRSHLRERFSSAQGMLDALQPQPITSTVVSPKIAKPTSNTGNWFKSLFIGVLIAGCGVLAIFFILPKMPSDFMQQQTRRSPQDDILTPEATATPTQAVSIPPTPVPISFYFLADSAFRDINNANNQITDLNNAGYTQAGKFWLRDYGNLSDKPYHQVYVARFSNRTSCIEFLKNYIQRNQDAYCAFASTDANASPNYFYGSQVETPQTDTKSSPSQAVINYYKTINSSNYSASWNQLSAKFKRNKSNNSYANYVEWWNKVQRVEVEQAKILSTSSNRATVEAKMKYFMTSGRVITDAQQFELIWNAAQRNWNFDDSTKLN